MWFRTKNGELKCVLRKDFYTDTDYYLHIAKLFQ